MTFRCWTSCASSTTADQTFECLQIAFGGLVTTTLRMGSVTPLAPLCSTLELAKERLEAVCGCKERLKELHHKCELLTTYVISQSDIGGAQLDIAPLTERVDELNDLVQAYADRSRFVTYLHLIISGKIDSLNSGIDTVVSIINLGASTRIAIAAEDWTRRLADLVSAKVLRLATTLKL